MIIPFEKLRARLLADPEVKAEYDALAPELELLNSGRIRDVLREAMADAKRQARAAGLTDEEVDAELDGWRAGR
jgi:hypothetical protein